MFLGELLIGSRLGDRHEAVLEPGHEDDRPFEPLRTVERQQRDAAAVRRCTFARDGVPQELDEAGAARPRIEVAILQRELGELFAAEELLAAERAASGLGPVRASPS